MGFRKLAGPAVLGAFALVAVLVAPAAFSVAADVPAGFHGSGTRTGAYLVQFRPEVSDQDASRAIRAVGAREVGDLSDISTHVVMLPHGHESDALQALSGDARVMHVERDDTSQATVTPHDPHWTQAWGPRLVRAPSAWSISTGNPATVIAVVDTGVDANQPDLRGRVLPGWDFQNDDSKPADDNGHGTAVAGVAAAAANNGVGIAGICWRCRILPVKVLNSNGSGSHSNIAAGIVWAAKHGADVINLSLAGPYPSNIVASAIAFAQRHGVVVVAAAGNEGSSRKFYPAAYPGVISVAATTGTDNLYSWSNRGSWVKVAAPGCAYTGKPRAAWSWWCGTSFATPVVAGIAALVKSFEPALSRTQVERTLLNSTTNVRGVGYGRVDALRAMRTAYSLSTPDPASFVAANAAQQGWTSADVDPSTTTVEPPATDPEPSSASDSATSAGVVSTDDMMLNPTATETKSETTPPARTESPNAATEGATGVKTEDATVLGAGGAAPTVAPLKVEMPLAPHVQPWFDEVLSERRTSTRTFQLTAGQARVQLRWLGTASLSIKVTNSAGQTLVAWHDSDGSITWDRTLAAGTYTVQVGLVSGASTPFEVTAQPS